MALATARFAPSSTALEPDPVRLTVKLLAAVKPLPRLMLPVWLGQSQTKFWKLWPKPSGVVVLLV